MTDYNTQLLAAILRDFREEWQLQIDVHDVDYILDLARSGGYPWLAGVLPTLDDILLSGLASGRADYSTWETRNGYPKILGGLWAAVFFSDGSLRPNPCVESIFALRQISRLFKKVFEVCSDDKVGDALASFVATDRSLTEYKRDPLHNLVSSICHPFLRRIGRRESFPFNHGPGAVAERLDSVERWDFPTISPAVADRFDMSDFFVNYHEDWPCTIGPVKGRVVAVPKTFDKPRLISIEPASNMYVQQGVLRSLDAAMASHPHLQMRDQEPNKRLAREGSVTGGLATIDLSEASDRVSSSLVAGIFSHVPSFRDLVFDVRTPVVEFPEWGTSLRLRKYASMGCALTFPIQMLVFHTLIISAIVRAQGDTSPQNIRRWNRHHDIGLFGDDIIVPVEYYTAVCDELVRAGLKVNSGKSFSTGPFRESCGGDYVNGVPVNPVYLRRHLPRTRHDVDSLQSAAATSTLMRERGLHHAAMLLSDRVQSILGPCPAGSGSISVAYPWSSRSRFNKSLQRHEVNAPVAVPVRVATRGSDMAKLAKALCAAGGPVIDPYRIERHGRPTRAFITRRWVAS